MEIGNLTPSVKVFSLHSDGTRSTRSNYPWRKCPSIHSY